MDVSQRYQLKRIVENNPARKHAFRLADARRFAVLKRTLTAIHPGIYRYLTLEALEKEFAALAAKLDAPLTEGEFFILISQIASRLKCGHTFANPYNQDKKLKERLFDRRNYLPFYFRLIDGKMIVTANASSKKIAVGSEIARLTASRSKRSSKNC